MNTKTIRWGLAAGAVTVVLSGAVLAQTGTLKSILDAEGETTRLAQQSQQRIDQISSQTQELLEKYRTELQQIDTLKIYNAQIQKLVDDQQKEMASLNRQIDNVTGISQGVTPLMIEMVDTLKKFVDADVPFLPEERKNRLLDLQNMMNSSDVSVSEKFRRIMESYQIENEYGWTVDSYTGPLELDGQTMQVDFLRFGRIALEFQTPDGNIRGFWNPKENRWEVLGSEYRNPIRDGLRIARKQAAPDLVELPIIAPESAK
jgi:Protein of unknown function (DUF3450)